MKKNCRIGMGVMNVNYVNNVILQTMLFLGVQLLDLCGVCRDEMGWKNSPKGVAVWLSNVLQYKAG